MDRPRISEDSSEAVDADVIGAEAAAASCVTTGTGSTTGDSASVNSVNGASALVTGAQGVSYTSVTPRPNRDSLSGSNYSVRARQRDSLRSSQRLATTDKRNVRKYQK